MLTYNLGKRSGVNCKLIQFSLLVAIVHNRDLKNNLFARNSSLFLIQGSYFKSPLLKLK